MNRNYSNISYAESPFGTLSEFMSKTFGWMFAGLLVTFAVGIGAVASGLIYPLINSGLFILTSIAELELRHARHLATILMVLQIQNVSHQYPNSHQN